MRCTAFAVGLLPVLAASSGRRLSAPPTQATYITDLEAGCVHRSIKK